MVEPREWFAPYAPNSTVLDTLRRQRDHGIPEPVTLEELVSGGVPRGTVHRTLRALEFLGLVDEEGQRTAVFDELANADIDTYRLALAKILRTAYSRIFEMVNPSTASDAELLSAFRGAVPQAQRDRMAGLFRALCREAGIARGGPIVRGSKRSWATAARLSLPLPQDEATSELDSESEPASASPQHPSSVPLAAYHSWFVQSSAPALETDRYGENRFAPDYTPLEALFRQLPRAGKWTSQRRDKWLIAVESAVDFLIEVTGEADSTAIEPQEREGGEHDLR